METDPYESRDIVLHNAVEMLEPRLVSTLTRIPGLWLEQDFETINVIESRARIARLRLALQSAKGDGGVLAILHDLDAILDSMIASREIGRSRHERALEIMGALVSAATLGQLTWQICHDLKAPFWVGWASLAILTVIAMMSTAINGGRGSTPRQETGNQ